MDALAAQFHDLRMPRASSDSEERLTTHNSHVYLIYDMHDPPPHPGKDFTRFVCVSDTHGSTPDVPSGDVLIHAGDLSVYGRKKTFETTIKWIRTLPHPIKLVIAGNHDRVLDPELYLQEGDDELAESILNQLTGQDAFKSGVRYLQYQSATIPENQWKAFGSPSWPDGAFLPEKQATPFYSAGAFQYYDSEALDVNSLIPRDTQILITHGPPKGVLDVSKRGKGVGCPALADRLFAPTAKNPSPSNKKPSRRSSDAPPAKADPAELVSTLQVESAGDWLPSVRLHVFGHIHEAWGAKIVLREPPSLSKSASRPKWAYPSASSTDRSSIPTSAVETVFVNAAVQRAGTLPIIVDLRNPTTESS